MRAARWMSFALALGLALWVWSARTSRAPHAAEPQGSPRDVLATDRAARDADLALFRADLERFRGGADELAPGLTALAERLAAAGRPDVRDVCAYYLRLSRAERQRGLAGENEHARLWGQVQEARASGVREDEWKDERALIESELGVLVASTQNDADGVPAARALSLRALLAIERVASDPTLRVDEQEQLARSAREDAREAERRFQRAGFLTPQLEPLWIQARVAMALDDLSAADELFARCRDVAQRVSNDEYERRALESMLALAQHTADTVSTTRVLHELGSRTDITGEWSLAHAYSDLLLADDEAERAVAFLERHPPSTPAEQASWTLRLANALGRAGRTAEARALLGAEPRAPATVQEKRERALTLALLDLRDGAARRARESAEDVLRGLRDLPNEGRARIQALTVLGTALLREGNAARARVELANALAAADELARRSRRVPGSDTQSNEFGELVGLETVALYADACVRMERDLEAAGAIERTQAQDLRRARAAAAGASASESGTVPAVDDASVARWASAYEAGLVTWVVGADTTVVVHVAADGSARGARIPRGRRALDEAARRLREAALAPDAARATELASEIERELVPPRIAERLARGPRGRLLCLVHGPIELLPLELWPLFTSGGLVPACLPGLPAADRDAAPLQAPDARWQLVGAPRDANGAELLPGARAELDALAALHPGSTLALGAECDRAALERALASGAPLHLATHVVFGECAGSSRFASAGLELAHGERLCARELAALRPRLPLAFLAACETGGGRFVDALGLQGIARAFLEGGTRNLLVTSWPIADDAARTFALAYHRALLAGRRPSEAASDARAELRAGGASAADWAAFRALGPD